MTKILIDASAWIEYFLGSEKGEKIREYIAPDNELFTLPINLAEVVSRIVRAEKEANTYVDYIKGLSSIINDSNFAQLAGEIHASVKAKKPKFSLADAFLLAAARTIKGKVITCDSDFNGFKEAKVL